MNQKDPFKSPEFERAVQILRRGGLVIFPTDTVYGVGCRADSAGSVLRLYRIKKKPEYQLSPILIADWNQFATLHCTSTPQIKKLIEAYWPGPLTVILKCQSEVFPPPLLGENRKISLRMPKFELVQALVRKLFVPIVATSANFHGEETPAKFEELDADFARLADFVIEGKCQLEKPSTIVDCTADPFRIVRQGALTVEPYYL